MTFDGPDGWSKKRISFKSHRLVAKRRQKRNSSVIICPVIVNQIITEALKVNEVKMHIANYCDFMDKTSFA